MKPQIVIDNTYGQAPVVSFLQKITASTLVAEIPCIMIDLLSSLDKISVDTSSSIAPVAVPFGPAK